MGIAGLNLNVIRRKSGGQRKHKRNALKCAYYRNYRSRNNKLRKLNRHVALHPSDAVALDARARARAA